MLLLMVLLVLIVINFIIHVIRTIDYNNQERTIDRTSNETSVTVDIHPRGMATDFWEKNDAIEGEILNAKIYEATVTNSTGSLLHDWSLRIDIQDQCYLNNAWNGTMEIHQKTESGEICQELSLQDCNEDDLKLDYIKGGQDILILLNRGDYIIYHPAEDQSFKESEIESTSSMAGEQSIGFIIYSLSGEDDLSYYTFTYYNQKNIFAGTEFTIFVILTPAWLIAMIVLLVILLMLKKYEKDIYKQSRLTTEFLDVFADYVDTREDVRKGHSRTVAQTARRIARKLGMTEMACDDVYYTALVHDIGKCNVPEYILKKKKGMTSEEEEIFRTHTKKGAEMFKDCTSIPGLANGVLYHHERYDGKGYPDGLEGENIPLVARIICIADCFETLSREDEHGIKKSDSDILEEMRADSGSIYDPTVFEAFSEVIIEMETESWKINI